MGRVRRFPVTERKRLTDAIVKRLPLPTTGKTITIDAGVFGFGARVTANGARSYVLRYTTRAGRERTFTIGDASVWRTTDAREKARELRREVEDGGDPLGDIEAERAAPTMLDLIERFRSEHLPKKRPRTALEYGYLLRLHIEPHFGQHTKVADVRFEDIDALHRKITKTGSTYAANRTIALLSKMFSLAKHPERQAADAIRLLLLTGARRGEVLSMRWDDIADGVWSKPPSSTKQKEHHQIPLTRLRWNCSQTSASASDRVRSSSSRATGPVVTASNSKRIGPRSARPQASRGCASTTSVTAMPRNW